jgi:ferritin-like metal-binding protein YciE
VETPALFCWSTVDDSAEGALRLLEVSEAVALGIEGKRALWGALAAAAEAAPALQVADYARLARRAEEQRQRVETVRLGAARAAFTATP